MTAFYENQKKRQPGAEGILTSMGSVSAKRPGPGQISWKDYFGHSVSSQPKPPTDEELIRQAAQAEMERLRKRKGWRSTILTSMTGTDEDANLFYKTRLG